MTSEWNEGEGLRFHERRWHERRTNPAPLRAFEEWHRRHPEWRRRKDDFPFVPADPFGEAKLPDKVIAVRYTINEATGEVTALPIPAPLGGPAPTAPDEGVGVRYCRACCRWTSATNQTASGRP